MIPLPLEFHDCLAQAMTRARALKTKDFHLDPTISIKKKFNLSFVSFCFRVLFLSHFVELFPVQPRSRMCGRASA